MTNQMSVTLGHAFCPQNPLVLVGAGNMGSALARGWLAAGLPPEALIILDPRKNLPESLAAASPESAGQVRLRHLISASDLPTPLSAQVTILAVKPQIMGEVLRDLSAALTKPGIVISVAAGTGLDMIKAAWPGDAGAKFVRVMTNTPSAIGAGASAMFGPGLNDQERDLVSQLMAVTGLALWLESEAAIHAVTGLSGSGPAYVFHLVEALAKAGEAAGLPPDVAGALARQTIIGAGALLAASPESADHLRTAVTSPNGTTEAGLAVLMADNGLTPLMERVVQAATARSIELGQKD